MALTYEGNFRLAEMITLKDTSAIDCHVAYSTSSSNFSEVSGSGYGRTQVTASDWAAASGSPTVTKATGVKLQSPDATGTWTTALSLWLIDGDSPSTTGIFYDGPLNVTATYASHIEIDAGNLFITIEDGFYQEGITRSAAIIGLDGLFGDPAPSYSTVYAALLTDNGTGPWEPSGYVETTYTGYSRVALTASNWARFSGAYLRYEADVLFPVNTGGTVTITGVMLFTAAAGGTELFRMPLSSSKTIETNEQPIIDFGDMFINVLYFGPT